MKKFLAKFMFAAVAVLSVAGFTSCNNADDDPYVPTPASVQEQAKPVAEARYLARIPEETFKYADITLTIEYADKKFTYKMDESTKRDSVYFDTLDGDGLESTLPARVLDIPFQYDASRLVKASLSYELTETGKQLIAHAAEGEKFPFAIYSKLGKCDKAGKFDEFNSQHDNRSFGNVYVKELDVFLEGLMGNNGANYCKRID